MPFLNIKKRKVQQENNKSKRIFVDSKTDLVQDTSPIIPILIDNNYKEQSILHTGSQYNFISEKKENRSNLEKIECKEEVISYFDSKEETRKKKLRQSSN